MNGLRRHAWWGLLVIWLIAFVFGVTDVVRGADADPAIATGLTGRSLEELRAESAAAYELYDFMTRVNGFSLAIMSLLGAAVVVLGFRRGRRWAWWTMWALPGWAAGAALFYVVAGVQSGQAPPPPLVSGPVVAVLSAAILLVCAPSFPLRERSDLDESQRQHGDRSARSPSA